MVDATTYFCELTRYDMSRKFPSGGINDKTLSDFVKFKVYMDNPMALTVLANSITLTPGTVTMDVTDDGIYTIHALTDNTANGIISGDMQGKVAKLFGEDTRFEILEVVPEGANEMFNEMKRNAEEKEVVR